MSSESEELYKKITPARLAKMSRVLENRTRKLTVVLEDIFQPHNASAVFRNCDAFGVQDVTIIENKYICRTSNSVDMGTAKWLTIHKYTCDEAILPKNGISNKHIVSQAANENTIRALDDLKKRGYFLAASTLRKGAGTIDDIPVDRPIALMLGTELTGLSDAAHEKADYLFTMPMLGFAQSFNLSVFSAICLQNLSKRIRALDDSWKLTESEKKSLYQNWRGRSNQRGNFVSKCD